MEKIQVAFDRLGIEEAIAVAGKCEAAVDWLEVGTSMIKEFGMESVRAFRQAFPQKKILADMKLMDNAAYECELAFAAGADIITVMGAAPRVSIDRTAACARAAGRSYMIDLLEVPEETIKMLAQDFTDAVFCLHASKDAQEAGQKNAGAERAALLQGRRIAVAGGIGRETVGGIAGSLQPEVFIVGEAITKSGQPLEEAQKIREAIRAGQVKKGE